MKSLHHKPGRFRRSLSLILTLVMMLSLAVGNLSSVNVLAAGTEPEENSEVASIKAGDLVQVKVGEELVTLDVYANGVYEAPISKTGDLEAVLYVNGKATEVSTSGTVAEGEQKVFRVTDGKLAIAAVEPAAIVGNFAGLDFVDADGNSYSIAAWDPADANAELAYACGGLYKRTFTFKALEDDL